MGQVLKDLGLCSEILDALSDTGEINPELAEILTGAGARVENSDDGVSCLLHFNPLLSPWKRRAVSCKKTRLDLGAQSLIVLSDENSIDLAVEPLCRLAKKN